MTTRPGPDDGEFGARVLVETGIGVDPGIDPRRTMRMSRVPPTSGSFRITLSDRMSGADR